MDPSDSKLSLSYADLMILPFLGDSGRWSNVGIVTVGLLRQTCLRCHVVAHVRRTGELRYEVMGKRDRVMPIWLSSYM
jgi:hypothetical protein